MGLKKIMAALKEGVIDSVIESIGWKIEVTDKSKCGGSGGTKPRNRRKSQYCVTSPSAHLPLWKNSLAWRARTLGRQKPATRALDLIRRNGTGKRSIRRHRNIACNYYRKQHSVIALLNRSG
jgi:hypothetical protein